MSIKCKISGRIQQHKSIQEMLKDKGIECAPTDKDGIFIVTGPDWLPKGKKVYCMAISMQWGDPTGVNFW